jgi:DNA-binding transcriptional regulator YiaG
MAPCFDLNLIKKRANYQWLESEYHLRYNSQSAHMTHSSSEEQIARAKRVLNLRQMTHLSRQKFEKRFGVATSTLQHWEDPKKNGLTIKGAKRLIGLVQQTGIFCTVEWLMHGIGPGPQALPTTSTPQDKPKTHKVNEIPEPEFIAGELALFSQHYPEVISTVVNDDCMEPRFIRGEYVAGVRRYRKAIDELIGLDCILVTKEGELLVRRLKSMDAPGLYTLSNLNMNTTVLRPVLYQVELVSAAPIIWARRLHE